MLKEVGRTQEGSNASACLDVAQNIAGFGSMGLGASSAAASSQEASSPFGKGLSFSSPATAASSQPSGGGFGAISGTSGFGAGGFAGFGQSQAASPFGGSPASSSAASGFGKQTTGHLEGWKVDIKVYLG